MFLAGWFWMPLGRGTGRRMGDTPDACAWSKKVLCWLWFMLLLGKDGGAFDTDEKLSVRRTVLSQWCWWWGCCGGNGGRLVSGSDLDTKQKSKVADFTTPNRECHSRRCRLLKSCLYDGFCRSNRSSSLLCADGTAVEAQPFYPTSLQLMSGFFPSLQTAASWLRQKRSSSACLSDSELILALSVTRTELKLLGIETRLTGDIRQGPCGPVQGFKLLFERRIEYWRVLLLHLWRKCLRKSRKHISSGIINRKLGREQSVWHVTESNENNFLII